MQATELERAQAFVAVIEFAQAQQQSSDSQQQLHLALLIAAQQLARTPRSAANGQQSAELDETYTALLRLSLKHSLVRHADCLVVESL